MLFGLSPSLAAGGTIMAVGFASLLMASFAPSSSYEAFGNEMAQEGREGIDVDAQDEGVNVLDGGGNKM